MASPKRPPRTAPTIEETASAVQATSRGARESKGGKAMNFNVDPEFFTEYKSFASMNNLSMKQLLENSFLEYKRNHS